MAKKQFKITPELLTAIGNYMADGYSDIETAAALGMSKTTFNNLKKRFDDPLYEDLMETLEVGKTQYEAWFEKIGKGLMTGKIQGKDSVWKAFGQNKFKWSDKSEVTDTTHKWDANTEAELNELLKNANKPKDV